MVFTPLPASASSIKHQTVFPFRCPWDAESHFVNSPCNLLFPPFHIPSRHMKDQSLLSNQGSSGPNLHSRKGHRRGRLKPPSWMESAWSWSALSSLPGWFSTFPLGVTYAHPHYQMPMEACPSDFPLLIAMRHYQVTAEYLYCHFYGTLAAFYMQMFVLACPESRRRKLRWGRPWKVTFPFIGPKGNNTKL